MERDRRAFFYEYRYYLLPEDCAGTEDLPEGEFEAKRLREDDCLAPDFVFDNISAEKLCIRDREKVFPVSVNLYTRGEYDEQLRNQVRRKCEGCVRYSGSCEGEDGLSGHYREMSLSGVCYIRQREGDSLGSGPSFSEWIRIFWYFCEPMLDRLAGWAEKDDQRSVNRALNKILTRFFYPFEFYCGKEDGQYCLCFSAWTCHPDARAVACLLAEEGSGEDSPLSGKGWKVYPYFPKGVYKPRLRPDYFRRPPRMFCGPNDDFSEICILDKEADRWTEQQQIGRKKALYRYLCSTIGEDVLLAGSESVSFTAQVPEGREEVTAEELAERIAKNVRPYAGENGEKIFPPVYYFRPNPEAEAERKPLPFKGDTIEWVTVCCGLGPECPQEGERAYLEEAGIVYAYLFFPANDGGAEKYRIWDEYISGLSGYPAEMPPGTGLYAKTVGSCLTGGGIAVDYMVTDEGEFYRVLSALSPVLKGLGAKIVTVKKEGVIVYDPGYVIRPADSEELA